MFVTSSSLSPSTYLTILSLNKQSSFSYLSHQPSKLPSPLSKSHFRYKSKQALRKLIFLTINAYHLIIKHHFPLFYIPILPNTQSILTEMKNLIVFCLVGFIATHALTITLKNGVEQCIWEVGKTGDQLYASYEVTKGDEKNIIVSVLFWKCDNVADYW